MTVSTEAAPTAPPKIRRDVLESLIGLMLGMFVAILSSSVVSSSLPKIIADLNGSQASYTWVVTATLLAMTVSTPIWGKLADLFSRKLLVQLSLILVVVGSGLAGLAHSTEMLIGFRVVQGLAAGGLTALSTVVISDLISPRERGRYMGVLGGVMSVGMVGGPLLGGVITDTSWLGWRWNFYVAVPFAVLAIIVLQKTLHLPKLPRRAVRIDYLGATLIAAGVSLLLIWVTLAGQKYAWASWQTAAMVVGGLVLLAVAVAVELRTAEPIIPMRLFRNRTVVLAIIASVTVGVAMFGTSVFLSQYMQIARDKTPTESGLLTLPMVLGSLVASIMVGQIISKTGRWKRWMVLGGALTIAGIALMGTIGSHTSFVLLSVYMAVLGLGVGMTMQNLVLVVQNSISVRDMGAATATVGFFRSMGGAMGVSALGALLGNRTATLIAEGLARLGIPTPGGSGGHAIPNMATLPGPVRAVVEDAFGQGVAELFLAAIPLAVISLVAILLLKEVPLGTKTGVELAREELANEAAGQAGATADLAPLTSASAPSTAGPR
jgi:EmrB/QacA subfamily drug resistance transporter